MSGRFRRRTFVRAAGIAAAGVVVPSVARADDVILKIDLPRSKTAVGRGVYCDVIVEREGGSVKDLGEPDFPELDGLDVSFQGQSFSQSVRIVNGIGTRKSTTTYSYLLVPNEPGTFALDVELEVEINGRTRTLSPATVPKLTATGSAAPVAKRADPSSRPDKADGEVFVWPIASKKKVYVGEQFVYTYELWERTMANVEHKTLPKLKDVYTRELRTPKSIRSEYLDGYRYRVHTILRRAAFAQKAGSLDLGGGTFTVRPSSGIGLFGPPRHSAPYNVEGPSIEIEVLPLPADGRPKDFASGNVGSFTIESSLDRDAIKQGDGVTLTVTIKGKGNIALVGPGAWPDFEGFASYDPKDESEEAIDGDVVGGRRTFEILLVAEEAGRLEVPAVSLSYFNPDKAAYETIESSPHVVEVEADENAVVSRDAEGVEEDSDATLAPPIESTMSRTKQRNPLMTPKRFWWGAGLVPLAATAWFGGGLLWRRFGPSETERAGAALAKAQQQRLARMRKTRGSDAFFENAGEFLHHLAQDWAGPEGKGLPRERLMKVLAKSVADQTRRELASLLELCDLARFGGGGAADHAQVLERVESLAQWRPD